MNKPAVNKRVQRSVIVGGLALVAAVGPAFGAAVGSALGGSVGSAFGGSARVDAQCLSSFGSLNGGVCLDQPSGAGGAGGSAPSGGGSAPSGGVPWVGIGPTQNGGPGISTSPLFPGQTFNVPLAP